MTNRFTYMWRLPTAAYLEDDAFENLKEMFLRNPEAADEIAFFVAEPTSTCYWPLEKFDRDLAIYAKRAEWFRSIGKKVGINVWPTIGEPAKDPCPGTPVIPEDFDMVVGMDGKTDPAVVCPMSPGFLKHITEKYRRMAATHPDFIFVDDDCRFTHIAAVPYPCFCDRCVSGFQNGIWTRETLVEALNRPENRSLRFAWSDYGGERLALFCRALRKAVDEVDPSIDLPFMSAGQTHTTYSGNYLRRCMEELRSRRGRPGHGFYYDSIPEGRFHKAMEVGRQVRQYPACTESVLWEEESHPRTFLNKATSTRLQEALLMLVMGGDGIAFNHIEGFEPRNALGLREYERETDLLVRARPVLQKYLDFSVNLPHPSGIYPLDSIYMMASMDCENGWFNEGGFNYSTGSPYAIDKAEELSFCGLPLTPFGEDSQVTVLTARTLDCLSEEELIRVLSGKVMLDREALARLEALGMGHLTGVKLGPTHPSSCEFLTDHPMNGSYAGTGRIGLDAAVELLLLDPAVEVLSSARDAYGLAGGALVTKYENTLGGKIAVFSHQPWKFLGSPAKLWQLRSLAAWFDLPGWVDYPEPWAVGKLVPYIRSDGKRASAAVFNAFLDEAPAFELRLKGSMTRARLMDLQGNIVPASVHRDGEYLMVSVKGIRPWGEVIVLAE